MENGSNEKEKINEIKKQKRKKIKIGLLIVLSLLVLVCGFKLYQDYIKRRNEARSGLVAEIGIGSTEKPKSNEKVNKPKFTIDLNSYIEFDDSNSEGYLSLRNVKDSSYAIRFSIKLEDTNEVIYKSSLVMPEGYIDYIKLDKKLGPGIYKAIGVYEFYELTNTDNKVSEQSVSLDLEIKN